MQFYDSEGDIARDKVSGDLFITTKQEIPDFFLDDLAESRLASQHQKCGDLHRVASIPTSIIDTMYRRGFNFYEAPAKDIIKWLKSMGYGYLFATAKNITFENR